MYNFNGLFPTYNEFGTFFINSGLDFNDPVTEKLYYFMKNEFGKRIFRWGDLEEIRGLCSLNLNNAFFMFKHFLEIHKLELNDLISNLSSNYGYGLPGEEEEITNENDEKYLATKQLNKSSAAKLSILRRLAFTELFTPVRIELAKCFISFF